MHTWQIRPRHLEPVVWQGRRSLKLCRVFYTALVKDMVCLVFSDMHSAKPWFTECFSRPLANYNFFHPTPSKFFYSQHIVGRTPCYNVIHFSDSAKKCFQQVFDNYFAECHCPGTRQTMTLCRVSLTQHSAKASSSSTIVPLYFFSYLHCPLYFFLMRIRPTLDKGLLTLLCLVRFTECYTPQRLCPVFLRVCRVPSTRQTTSGLH